MNTKKQYKVTIEQVAGGYDLIISNDPHQAVLFIHDKTQANELSKRIIDIACEQKIDINAAMAVFNQGSGMFQSDEIRIPKL